MSRHSKKSKRQDLLHDKCMHCPLCDKGMVTGQQFIDYVRLANAIPEIQKDLNETVLKAVNGELLSLTEADLGFLWDLKIDPETEGF